jgi:hypothetical protein
MKKTIFIASFLTFTNFVVSCKKEAAAGFSNADYLAKADCTGATPTYTKNIKTIFDTKCATSGCHAETSAAKGIDLSSLDKSKVHFNAHNLLCSINQESDCIKMPRTGSKLADADIKSITCWAKNGYPQ